MQLRAADQLRGADPVLGQPIAVVVGMAQQLDITHAPTVTGLLAAVSSFRNR